MALNTSFLSILFVFTFSSSVFVFPNKALWLANIRRKMFDLAQVSVGHSIVLSSSRSCICCHNSELTGFGGFWWQTQLCVFVLHCARFRVLDFDGRFTRSLSHCEAQCATVKIAHKGLEQLEKNCNRAVKMSGSFRNT